MLKTLKIRYRYSRDATGRGIAIAVGNKQRARQDGEQACPDSIDNGMISVDVFTTWASEHHSKIRKSTHARPLAPACTELSDG